MATTKKRKMFIPVDKKADGTVDKDTLYERFQHNGVNFVYKKGEVAEVPDWLFEMNPAYKQYEVPNN